jgi:hypothetical protein
MHVGGAASRAWELQYDAKAAEANRLDNYLPLFVSVRPRGRRAQNLGQEGRNPLTPGAGSAKKESFYDSRRCAKASKAGQGDHPNPEGCSVRLA